MPSYLPHQYAFKSPSIKPSYGRGPSPWISEPEVGRARAPMRPNPVSSGSRRNFNRAWGGDSEARLRGLHQFVSGTTHDIGRALLYGAIVGDSVAEAEDARDGQGGRLGTPDQYQRPRARVLEGEEKESKAIGGKPFGELGSGPSVTTVGTPQGIGSPPVARTSEPPKALMPGPQDEHSRDMNEAAGIAGRTFSMGTSAPLGKVPYGAPEDAQKARRRPAGMDPRKRGTWL